MLFSKRMELEREYYKWIEDNREKFAVQDCPSNVIAFLDSKGMFNVLEKKTEQRCWGGIDLSDKNNSTFLSFLIEYLDDHGVLGTRCPFNKMSKVGSFGCIECKSFISNDTIRNIVVCGGVNRGK